MYFGVTIWDMGEDVIPWVWRTVSSFVSELYDCKPITKSPVSRSSMVSCIPHCLHFYVSISQTLCKHTFLGIMSWNTMYHTDLVLSENITLWILTHTCYHSATGWSCTKCTCLCFLSAVLTVHKVSYTLRCKGCPVSACLCGSVYTHSWKWMRRYSKVRRITSMCGGSL